jgi:CRISPR/Cas system endoribonuclease Cas6 (RAMP superfamily)
LLGRISSLSYFHCGQPLQADFRGLIDRAAQVQLVNSQTRWEDWSRFSGRQHQRIELGGLIGRATYRGPLAEYLPLLALGELVHVGKGTVFGNGQYQIEQEQTQA